MDVELVSSSNLKLYPLDQDIAGKGTIFVIPKQGDVFLGLAARIRDETSITTLTTQNRKFTKSFCKFEPPWKYRVQGLEFPAKGPLPVGFIDGDVQLVVNTPLESINVTYWIFSKTIKKILDSDLALRDHTNRVSVINGIVELDKV